MVQVFTAWVNYHLSHKKVRVHNLEADLSDGVVLITLAEVLLDEHIDVSNNYFKVKICLLIFHIAAMLCLIL